MTFRTLIQDVLINMADTRTIQPASIIDTAVQELPVEVLQMIRLI